MNIVQITSESYPFTEGLECDIKELGEGVFYLSSHLADEGNVVSIFLPYYSIFDLKNFDVKHSGKKTWVASKNATYEFDIYTATYNGVNFYLMSNKQLFGRTGIYGSGGQDYSDNDIRFSAFCRACLNYISYHMPDIDILHSYEWQTALVPVYRNIKHANMDWVTVHTIYEVENQGVFTKYSIDNIGLPWELHNIDHLEYYDNINFIKGAVFHADAIVSTDMSQAGSFLLSTTAFGLDGVFRKYQSKIAVISNGLEYSEWNPEDDELIFSSYTQEDPVQKILNKNAFCKEYDLNPDYPLFCVINEYIRPDSQTLQEILRRLPEMSLNLFIYLSKPGEYILIFFKD